jgi:hypothetical protein
MPESLTRGGSFGSGLIITDNMELIQKIKETLRKDFLAHKKEILVPLLVDFIKNKAPQLIENSEDLRVITFEYDMPFDFAYVAYPDPNIIPQDHWLDQFTIDASEDDDDERLESVLAGNDIVQDDDLGWVKKDTSKEIDMWEINKELEHKFFAECWQTAKAQTGSKYRCFFLEHDVYRGIDADTGKEIESEEIPDVLTKEGFDFVLYEEDLKEVTEPKKPWWKFW